LPARILHLVTSLDRFTAANAILPLARELPQDAFENHAVSLSVGGPLCSEFENAPLNFQLIERRWAADPVALGNLILHTKRTQPQIIHAWDDLASKYAALAAPWVAGAKLVAEYRRISLKNSAIRFPLPRRFRSPALLKVTPLESIRDAVANTAKMEAAALRRTVGDDAWRVIPPSVELLSRDTASSKMTNRESLLSELGFPMDAKLIGIACPLEPSFGVKELIWAADMLRVLHPNIRLVILGEGLQRPHLERFAQTAAEETDIRFLGDRADWRDVVASLDLFWDGSEPHAEFGQPLLAALAGGVPVVASDTPVHRELITDGETGYLAKLAGRAEWTRNTDALLVDPALAERIGSAGRNRAEQQFSLSQSARNYAELYRELVG